MRRHAAAGFRRRAGPLGSWLHLATAVGLSAVLLAGAATPPASAAIDQTSPPSGHDPVTVELVDQPAWVRPGEPFDVRVRVTGAPAGASIDMIVHDRLESRSEFRTTLDGELGGDEYAVAPQPLPGPDATVADIGFTPGAPGTGLSGAGVYPVVVRALSGGDVIGRAVTYLSYLKSATPEFPPLEVAVLVDIAAARALQPDGAYELPAGTLARTRERVQVLQDTTGVPLTLAPLPETLEALAHGGPAEAAAVDALRELAADRPVLARPFVDVDLAALERSDLIAEANAQAHGGANVARLRLGREPTPGVWLSGPTFGAESARLAVELGISRAVVPPSAVDDSDADGDDGDDEEPPGLPAAPVRLGEGGPLTMVSDPALAAHLTSSDGVVAAHRFLADLTITWLEAPSIPRGAVIHLPADAVIHPDVVSRALAALADGQAVRVVPISQLFDDVPPPAEDPTTVTPAPGSTADLRSIAGALQSARERVSGVGGLVDDPDVGMSLEQSLLLGTGAATPDDQRAAYVERTTAALDQLSGVVTLPDEFRITLTSRSSTIPVTLTNLSDRELTVRVQLDGDQLEFPEGAVLTPVLAPGTTRLEVPVRARTSGAFTLAVEVTSPDGSIVLDTSIFDVRSTVISGVGLVLSIGAGLFLAIWWARHWRSARRSRHLMPPGAATRRAVGPGRPPAATAPAMTGDGPYRPAHMARQRTRSG